MRPSLKSLGQSAALILGVIAFAALTLNALRSDQGPNPVYDMAAWAAWAGDDPINALVMLVSAILAGFGAWGTVSNLIRPNASRADVTEASQQTRDVVVETAAAAATRDADLAAHLARVEAKIEAMSRSAGAAPDAGRSAGVSQALASIAASVDAGTADARDALRQEDPRAVVDALMATEGPERLQRLKEAAALAAGFDVARAARAHALAVEIEPEPIALLDLARLRWDLRQIDDGVAAALRAADLTSDPVQRGEALVLAASIAMSGDRHDEAERHLTQAAEALDALGRKAKGEPDARRQLAILNSARGDLARARGDLVAAQPAYALSAEILSALAAARPESLWRQRDLFVVQERLGDVAQANRDLKAARAAREFCLMIASELVERAPDDSQPLWDVSTAHHKLGVLIGLEGGDREVALQAFERAVTLRERLHARDPGNVEWLRGLVVTLRHKGIALWNSTRSEEALATLDRAVVLTRRLDADPGADDVRDATATDLTRVGRGLARTDPPTQAVSPLTAAFDLRRRLAPTAADRDAALTAVCDVGQLLADVHRRSGDGQAALKVADVCLEVCLERRAADPTDKAWLDRTARLHGVRAEVHEGLAQWSEAADHFARSRAALLTLKAAGPGDPAAVERLIEVTREAEAAARAKAA